MTDNNDLKGISGWLILVAIGVIFGPVRLLYTYIPLYTSIFEDGTWEALTTVGSEVHNPYWGMLLIGEMMFNSLLVVACVYLIYLFFSKHYLFPKVYIGIVVASLIFIPLDVWIVTMIFPDVPMFDPETTKEFVRTLFAGVIWIPYMLVSKRVKATFMEHRPIKQDEVPQAVIEKQNSQ